MSDVLPVVRCDRESARMRGTGRRNRAGRRVRGKIGAVTVREGFEALTEAFELAPISLDLRGLGRCEIANRRDLFFSEQLIEAHGACLCIKREYHDCPSEIGRASRREEVCPS